MPALINLKKDEEVGENIKWYPKWMEKLEISHKRLKVAKKDSTQKKWLGWRQWSFGLERRKLIGVLEGRERPTLNWRMKKSVLSRSYLWRQRGCLNILCISLPSISDDKWQCLYLFTLINNKQYYIHYFFYK